MLDHKAPVTKGLHTLDLGLSHGRVVQNSRNLRWQNRIKFQTANGGPQFEGSSM